MATKAKCSQCNERDSFAKGLCSRCYGIQWRAAKQVESRSSTALVTTSATPIVEGEIVIDKPAEELPPPTSEAHLVARNPAEMQAAQADLLEWLKLKLTTTETEVRDMNAAITEARNNKWKDDALIRARNRVVNLETFYFKMLMAVEAGYTIIPDFPIDVFAIRVVRKGVTAQGSERQGEWGWPTIDNERSDRPPAGVGEYKNPSQMVYHRERKTTNMDGNQITHRSTTAADWQDEIIFPMTAARPGVMNATSQAMALKVFDQIGICRPVEQSPTGRAIVGWGKGDPLILGQILHRRASGLKVASFIIAWHLDLNQL